MAFFGKVAGKAAQPMMGAARALPKPQGLGPSQNTMMSRIGQGMQPKTAQPIPQQGSGLFGKMGPIANSFKPQLPSMPAPMQDEGMLKPQVMPRFDNQETQAPELGQTPEQQLQQQQKVQNLAGQMGQGLGPRQGMWQNLMNRFNQARPQPYGMM